jgi:hypothetical protein
MTSLKTTAIHAHTDLGWRPDLRSPLVLGLLALLSLQLLLALGLRLRETGMAAPSAPTSLLAFTPEDVTRVRIEGVGGADGVTLKRAENAQWVLADPVNFPVAPSKVDQLLSQLAGLKRPLPIATSAEARKRFKLTDDGFERRLTLEGKDGPLATLLIGDSPGFRRLFARPANDPAVYDLTLTLSDFSARRDDWLDPGLLRLEQERIARIAGRDWTLIKESDKWRLEGSEQAIDQSAANTLAMRLANLGYRGVLGTEDDPAYRQQEPALVFTLGLTDGASRIYRISQAENSEDYVLKELVPSGAEGLARPYFFKLSKYDLEGLLDANATRLGVQPAAVDQPDDATETTPTAVEPSAIETSVVEPSR